MQENTSPILWSIVIPAYNEARRLPKYLADVLAYFEQRADRFEVLIVDDGSVDGTAQLVRTIAASHPAVRMCVLPQNCGKGYAVRIGMLRARGRFRLMADADGATPIAEIARLEAALQHDSYELAVASRALPDGSVVRRTLPHRTFSGSVFNAAVRCMGVKNISDTQCGFKLFRADVAEDLFSALQTDGFGFDVELLLLAQKKGYRIIEVPVNWADQPGSKVSVATDGVRMLWQVAVARWRIGGSCGQAARKKLKVALEFPGEPLRQTTDLVRERRRGGLDG